jgi:hypothetical protein
MLLSPNVAEILSKFHKTEHPSHAALNAISRPKKTRIPWHSSKQTKVLQICVVRATSSLLYNRIAGTVWIDDIQLVPVRTTEDKQPNRP